MIDIGIIWRMGKANNMLNIREKTVYMECNLFIIWFKMLNGGNGKFINHLVDGPLYYISMVNPVIHKYHLF